MADPDSSPTTDLTLGKPSSPDYPSAAAPLREGPGTRIGPYRILQLIGEGGFGTVFMAQQEQPVQRKVALKIIKLGMDTRQVVARFEQERQALAMMDHPNIARVLDAGATDTGRPYFVMELVKGDPIVEYCDRNNLSVQDRLDLFAQVCAAVQHAHTKGIIHRDIKPSNILVSTQDGKPGTKVIDFGIAKATSARLTEKTLFTEHRQLIGTPEYMSPEQAEGSMDIDTRTDVYSLGVLLYELLTGTTPFSTKELRSAAYAEIQRIIREVEPPVPSTRLSQNTDTIVGIAAKRHTEPRKLGSLVRGELDWIVMKAMEKDRQRRYETASGLAMDIRRYLAGEAVVAAPPGAAYRIRKFARRHRGVVMSGSAVAAALLVGMIAFAWQARIAQRERDAARTEQARAVAAEAETGKRAEELKQVAAFQAKMLSGIDPADAGDKLMSDIRERFAAALAKDGVPEAERAARAESFARDLGEVNATDAATDLIDRTILKPAITAVNGQFKDQPVVDASLRGTLSELYRILGRYDDATALQTRALETRRRVLGDDNPDTLDSMNNLASVLESQGKDTEAEALFREALDKRRRAGGDDHPETLAVMGNLGNLLRGKGKYDEAEPLLRASLEGRRRVKGPEDRGTLIALNTYGFLLIDQGRMAAAEPYWRESYETGKRVFGADDPDVFVWTNNLGGLLSAQGHWREAEPLYREAFESCRRLRGEEHPQTLSCMRNVAQALRRQGRYAEAEPPTRTVLETRRRVLGDEHPATLDAMGEMGSLLQAQRKFDEAEPYYRDQLEKRQRILGKEHPDTLNSLSNLGFFLKSKGKTEEAERYNREAMEARRRVLGDEHPGTLMSESNFCVDLMDAGKLEEAETLGRAVLEKRSRVLGPDHPDTLVSTNILSQALRRQNKLNEAESCLRAALESGVRVLGPDHPDTLIFTVNLGGLLQEAGKPDEADSILSDASERCTRALGPTHPTTLGAIILLGSVRQDQGKPDDVIALLSPIEDKARAAFTGAGAARVASLLTDLGQARAALAKNAGEFAAAEADLLEAHAIYLSTRGEKHKSTRECAQAVADFYASWERTEPDKGHAVKAAEWKAKAGGEGRSAKAGS